MNMITQETRQLSFKDIQDKKKRRYEQILHRLQDREMTAKEIAIEMFELGMIASTERNYTAPRLTELESIGLVEVVGKKKCDFTGKKVAIYRLTQQGLETININHIPTID